VGEGGCYLLGDGRGGRRGMEGGREAWKERTYLDAKPRAVSEADTPRAIPRPVRSLDSTNEVRTLGDGARDLREGGREGK